jgi:hypothetical protein
MPLVELRAASWCWRWLVFVNQPHCTYASPSVERPFMMQIGRLLRSLTRMYTIHLRKLALHFCNLDRVIVDEHNALKPNLKVCCK